MTLEYLQSHIDALWRHPLKAEGFGRYNIYAPSDGVSVDDELSHLLYYHQHVGFYYTSEFYIEVRKAFIRNYALPYFDQKKLDEKTTLPSLTFIPKALRNISMLYSFGVTRTIDNEDGTIDQEKTDKYFEFVDQALLDQSAIEEYRLTKLCGVVAIRIDYDTEEKAISFDLRPPSEFRVLWDDSKRVTKYAFSTMRTIKGRYQQAIEVYTEEQHYILDTKGSRFSIDENGDGVTFEEETAKNEFGFIPVVFWHSDSNGFYASDMHGLVESCISHNYTKLLRDIDQTFAANNTLLLINTGVGSNTASQQEAEGRTDNSEIKLDVGTRSAIIVENIGQELISPSAEIVAGTPHSDVLTDNMDSDKREALINEGLSVSTFSDETRDISGRAIKAEKEELILIRDTDKVIYTVFEKEKLAMIARVINVFETAGLSEDPADYTVDYIEEQYDDVDPLKDLEYDLKRLQIGVLDILTFSRKHDSDVNTVEEAVKRMKANAAIYEQVRLAVFDDVTPDTEPEEQTALLEASESGT